MAYPSHHKSVLIISVLHSKWCSRSKLECMTWDVLVPWWMSLWPRCAWSAELHRWNLEYLWAFSECKWLDQALDLAGYPRSRYCGYAVPPALTINAHFSLYFIFAQTRCIERKMYDQYIRNDLLYIIISGICILTRLVELKRRVLHPLEINSSSLK